MTENYINFKRQRELGDIITDTFKFVRENFRQLLGLIIKNVGPVFFILMLALGYYHYSGGANPFMNLGDRDITPLLISFAFLMIAAFAFIVFLQGTLLFAIKSYVDNQGTIVNEEVSAGIKSSIGKLMGVTFMAGLLTFIGTLFCFLPGIYLWVPLSLATVLLVFRGRGIFDSIGDTFTIVKDNWWITFATLFVMTLLVYIIGLIFQVPLFIYIIIKAMTVAQEGSAADPSALFDWVYTLLSVVAYLGQYVLYGIISIATAFIYFNLNEKKNFTGTFETISNLGSENN